MAYEIAILDLLKMDTTEAAIIDTMKRRFGARKGILFYPEDDEDTELSER